MSKALLIGALAQSQSISKADAEGQIDNVVSAIQHATQNDGDKIIIRGFGTFQRKHVAAKAGRNPATGESIQIAARSVLKFKAAK